MGILNATPDSYYKPSRLGGLDQLEEQADRLLGEGADWLDLGGCSTRPGADWPSIDEEWSRIKGAFGRLRLRFGPNLPLSVDTFRAEVLAAHSKKAQTWLTTFRAEPWTP